VSPHPGEARHERAGEAAPSCGASESWVDAAEVAWTDLRSHARRDGLILVGPDLDLTQAATAVARDDRERVAGWIAAERLRKPTRPLLEAWEADPRIRFRVRIVKPYVLAQVADGRGDEG